jgi:phosphatidylserine/phosphatidylglycerophosphate/cardiolipin synthase-like enzyme
VTRAKKGRRPGPKEFLLSLFLIIIVWATGDLLGIGQRPDPVAEPDPDGRIEVFFTTPANPTPPTARLDARLSALIDGAQRSIDVAVYDFELVPLAEALVRAHERGVRVRLVTDSDYAEEPGPTTLQAAGVPIVTDERTPFMHNKFVVIDGYRVWTGSWNFTEAGTTRHNNNVVLARSSKLATNYTAEFEEMFVDGAFGTTSPAAIPYPVLDLDGVRVETIYGSEGDAAARIVDLIQDAEESVHFMAFVLTDDAITRALIAQHRAGLEIAGVLEARHTGSLGAAYPALRQAGVDVLEDGNPYLMHHKVILLDRAIVVTGSYNFSANAANNNDENVLILHDPEIAGAYMDEFARVYTLGSE